MFDMQTFKLVHSELIMWTQYIEQDLKLVFASVRGGDFDKNMEELDNANFGKILKEFQKLDRQTKFASFSDDSYSLLNKIREIRNYWCHQCYLDFHYYTDPDEHQKAFEEVATRLHYDEERIYELHLKVEKLRKREVQKYKNGRQQPRTIKLK